MSQLMVLAAAGTGCAAWGLLTSAPGARASRAARSTRAGAESAPPHASPGNAPTGDGGGHRGTVAAIAAGLGCTALVGGVLGAALGIAVAIGAHRAFARMETPQLRRRRRRLAADLPLAADLIGAGLSAGGSVHTVGRAVADAIGGPLADELRAVTAAVELGADPVDAWLTLAPQPELAPLARTMARALESGAPLSPALARLADDRRRAARAAASAAARRAGVHATAPLGLCFLPAFVLIGVVPLVVSVVGTWSG